MYEDMPKECQAGSAVERKSQISSIYDALKNTINICDRNANILSSKLAPVTRCVPPECATDKKAFQQETVLGRALEELNDQLKQVNSVYESLVDRLEV